MFQYLSVGKKLDPLEEDFKETPTLNKYIKKTMMLSVCVSWCDCTNECGHFKKKKGRKERNQIGILKGDSLICVK